MSWAELCYQAAVAVRLAHRLLLTIAMTMTPSLTEQTVDDQSNVGRRTATFARRSETVPSPQLVTYKNTTIDSC